MAQVCKCNNGTTVTRGVKPPADCSSNRTTGCEGCCDGGVLDNGGRILGTNRGVRRKIRGRRIRPYYRNVSGDGVVKAGLQGGIIAGALVVGVLLYAMVRVSQSK